MWTIGVVSAFPYAAADCDYCGCDRRPFEVFEVGLGVWAADFLDYCASLLADVCCLFVGVGARGHLTGCLVELLEGADGHDLGVLRVAVGDDLEAQDDVCETSSRGLVGERSSPHCAANHGRQRGLFPEFQVEAVYFFEPSIAAVEFVLQVVDCLFVFSVFTVF